jgi:hypothetical protein
MRELKLSNSEFDSLEFVLRSIQSAGFEFGGIHDKNLDTMRLKIEKISERVDK